MKKYEKQYFEGLKRVYTKDELLQMVSDKDRILTPVEVSKILDTFWPLDYKDTFIVPKGKKAKKDLGEKGRYLVFRGGGILFNGKNDVPGLKALGEKEKAGKLLLRRSKLNRILAGETDYLNEPLTPEAIGQFKKERDLIQEGVLKAVGPLLDPDSIITQPGGETAGNGKTDENNGGISLPPEIDRPEARKAFEKAGTPLDGLNILQNNGEAAGQSVMHYHLHVLPRIKGDDPLFPLWSEAAMESGDMKALAESLKGALES